MNSEDHVASTPAERPPISDAPAPATKPDGRYEGLPLRPTAIFRYAYPWLRLILSLAARIFAPRFRVSGTRHVPRRGPVLLAPNHISDCDPPFVYAATPRPLWFMAKNEIFAIRYLGRLIRLFGAFPVEPNGADRAALRHAEKLLAAGQAVVVFPEGRCSVSGELEPILPGVVMLALRAGVPIVPVGLWNTTSVIPYGSVIPRPTNDVVAVHFGKPIRLDDLGHLGKREAREVAGERLRLAIVAARQAAINDSSR
jgi:1-acyl-sn-glycerol-3-phosphate acyltransferase